MTRNKINKLKVAIYDVGSSIYPKFPFHPYRRYPEYTFGDLSSEHNNVYDAVRNLFRELGYDRKNFGKITWNPLGELIKPGMKVIIKPNFVLSFNANGKDIYSVITHPSVIRAVADYCLIALKGKGKLTIADAPQYNCNFTDLLEITQLDKVVDYLKSKSTVDIRIIDLRNYWATKHHFPSCTKKLSGDPEGKVVVNLGKDSQLYGLKNYKRFYGAVYDRNETIEHHTGNNQSYEISKTILNSDVFISIPKMKVHKKVGVTLNLKNLVGICTNKNYIVHYAIGTPSEGGDQFPNDYLTPTQAKVIKFERWMYDTFLSSRTLLGEYIHRLIYGFLYLKIFSHFGLAIPKDVRRKDAGNWPGNDTAWRMVVDLGKIILFSDKNGKIHKRQQRKTFSIVDGIVGGEKYGPLDPDPKKSGVLVAGENFLFVDLVSSRLMGFDPNKIKQYSSLQNRINYGLKNIKNITIISNFRKHKSALLNNKDRFYNYRSYPGWENININDKL